MNRERSPVVQLRDVVVSVPGRQLLAGASLTVGAGESVAVMGPSGSGKTTLLNCIAGLARPTGGKVSVAGLQYEDASESRLSAHRLRSIGMVFQFGELLPELSVVENVALPALFAGRDDATTVARQQLAKVDLAQAAERFPDSLSGGETQRVAIARALATEPAVVLADEPTGALDEENAKLITAQLIAACAEGGAALVIATHDSAVARATDRILRLRAGQLVAELAAP